MKIQVEVQGQFLPQGVRSSVTHQPLYTGTGTLQHQTGGAIPHPLLSWVFLIPTHKSTLSLHQERRFLSFHPLQYGPINILVLYFQPRLCNTDHSWLVWISPELPRMLLKAQEEQKCFNQLNQSNKKKGRLDLKIYPATFATRCDDVFVLFL